MAVWIALGAVALALGVVVLALMIGDKNGASDSDQDGGAGA